MTNKTIVLIIVLMAVIGLSGIAAAKNPRNMHKDEDDCSNEQGGTHGHFVPSGDRPEGKKGKCDDKKDEDEDEEECGNGQGETYGNLLPVRNNLGIENGNVCGHRAPGSDTLPA